jgi:diadenylate cyclase
MILANLAASLSNFFHWKDAIDILLVSVLLYQLYKIIKGTVAVNVFIGVLAIYLVNLMVNFLQMKLLGTIFRQVLGVGAIALIILFQQEIRKFLILIGIKSYNSKQAEWLFQLVPSFSKKGKIETKFKPIINACYNMSKTNTGALIVLSNDSDLSFYSSTGDIIDANVNTRLIENIFFKNSPLHDGAVIIQKDKIVAARCVLPVTENESFPPHLGMRHRAASGISEVSSCIVLIVSEETGKVSYAKNGKLRTQVSKEELTKFLSKDYKLGN